MSLPDLRWTPYEPEKLNWKEVPRGRIVATDAVASRACDSRCVITIGAFDGLHMGHRTLVAAACEDARAQGLPCVAVMFDPDPAEVLRPESVRGARLLGCEDRAAGLIELGVSAVVLLAFDEAMAQTEPSAFVHDVLLPNLHPASIHVGEDFRFGCRGRGDVRLLAELGVEFGFRVHGHELVRSGSDFVSATRVRRLLEDGLLDEANELLCRCHYVSGTVEHGRGEGTGFGFPTANVRCAPMECMPAEGVYACFVVCGSRAWPAAANVGAPPTFGGGGEAFLEANLIGFSGDLYGEEVSVVFVRWLRASRKFDSLEELERVVLGNIAWVRENLGSSELEVTRD